MFHQVLAVEAIEIASEDPFSLICSSLACTMLQFIPWSASRHLTLHKYEGLVSLIFSRRPSHRGAVEIRR